MNYFLAIIIKSSWYIRNNKIINFLILYHMSQKIWQGFRDFIWRGNVIDLAVGIMVGSAFNNVVSALVRDIMTPLIAAIFQQPDFSKLTFTLRGSQFFYGDFL